MTSRTALLVWPVLVMVAASACAMAPRPPASAGSGLGRVGTPAPSLSLPLLGGGTRDLVGQRGKVVVLNFWATWCGPCRAEMPELQQLSDDLRDQPFTLLSVDLDEDGPTIEAFRDELGLRMPMLMDQDGDVAASYGVRGLPATFLVDQHGELRQQRLGPLVTGDAATAWSRAWIASQVRTLEQRET
jgi:cytochrome c biogenesis protein CcmG, thiol:disulfide interchange protein DsbE